MKASNDKSPEARESRQKGPQTIAAIIYADYLEAAARRIKKMRSKEKTRLLLLASAARYFEHGTHADMSVSDVVKGANISHGTFYLYFKSRDDLTASLLSEFVEFELMTMPIFDPKTPPFDMRRAWTRWYRDAFRLNVGLMRNMVLLSDTMPEIAAIWRMRGKRMVARLLDYYRQRYGLTDEELNMLRIALHGVGSMSDHNLFAMYGVHGAAETSEERNEDLICELHCTLGFRAIFGEDPPLEELSYMRPFIALKDKMREPVS